MKIALVMTFIEEKTFFIENFLSWVVHNLQEIIGGNQVKAFVEKNIFKFSDLKTKEHRKIILGLN